MMSDKVAVYAGTRNIYPQMYTALKSLVLNNDMDRVYLLIEDDEFPYTIPDNVHPVNVSGQNWFEEGSPNFKTIYSYMTLLRCVLGQMMPDEKLVLWLDCDTIVDDDITDLFSMNMDGYYYAGVLEPDKSKDVFTYINVGVLLCNLEVLRETKKDLELCGFLNSYPFIWPDQDAINILCQGRIRLISSDYNSNSFVAKSLRPKVYHYAAMKDYKNHWAYKKYEQIELQKGDKPDA